MSGRTPADPGGPPADPGGSWRTPADPGGPRSVIAAAGCRAKGVSTPAHALVRPELTR